MKAPTAMCLAIVTLAVVVAGCRAASPSGEVDRLFWSGDLATLDGHPVGDSGLRLEIEAAAGRPGPYFYRLTTGCSIGGFVDEAGSASPVESMRPCLDGDLQLLARLDKIAGNSSRLTWTNSSATLASPEGEAGFEAMR